LNTYNLHNLQEESIWCIPYVHSYYLRQCRLQFVGQTV
jgi:hypothetical protein